jgi:SAM-dependent methyltransferase
MYPQTDRSFSGLTERLLARIAGYPGERVLDIGCGAGELSLAIARARPRAEVVGVDVSPELVAVARERAADNNRIRLVHADASQWEEPDFAPDLLVSRHGVMFFNDPPGAFAHLRGVSTTDAQLVFSCFRTARENHWASDLAELIGLPAGDPHAPGPFAFADPQRVEAILAEGGWGKFDFEPVDFAYVAGMGTDPVGDALHLFTRIGPAAPALRAMEGKAREAALAKIGEWLEANRTGDMVAFSAAAWIVTANADRRHRRR